MKVAQKAPALLSCSNKQPPACKAKTMSHFIWSLNTGLAVHELAQFLQEAVGETLQELWISYNNIEKLKGINVLKKLKVCIQANFLNLDAPDILLWLFCNWNIIEINSFLFWLKVFNKKSSTNRK